MEGTSIEEHLDAAAAAGFDAVSLRPLAVRAWQRQAPRRSPVQLAERLRDLGLGLAELDPVVGWHDAVGGARVPAAGEPVPDVVRADLDLAAELGARAVTALVPPGATWSDGPGVAGLVALAAAAGERGLLVQVEPFGWSALGTLPAAARAVRAAGAADVGVMVDTWHLARAGGDATTVDALATREVVGVQLADGPAEPEHDDPAEDNRRGRRWPGEGDHHPERVLASLLGRGWRGPVAVEVFGPTPDPVARARRARRSLDAAVASAAVPADRPDPRHHGPSHGRGA
jgi:sugar phosphate isomerase/epimerase